MLTWLIAVFFAVTPHTCAPVPVAHMSDAAVTQLRTAGWTGDPTDGMEALYAPGCVDAR